MTIDVNVLRRLTEAAIQKGKEEAERQKQIQLEEERRQKEMEELRAKGIIAQIPHRAKTEAIAGRSHAIVMGIAYSDYNKPRGNNEWNICRPEWLVGAAKIVWDYCVGANLKPTLEFWHDGVGIKSGFNIVIHW